ncbi:MAG: D-alanyl-D-alanine carboxypeptidase [Candidatus Marinimicrobia bacterium]|nr:D-alanyl-D-alanine carboxypeptidase [Candidatus Neomarinimicrobiota bacterium]
MLFLKNKDIKIIFTTLIILISLISCSTTSKLRKDFRKNEKANSYFIGFVLYDPIAKKEIINHNGDKYFTPASNTKLITFYTAYKTFSDSVTSLYYCKTNDSLIIKGAADPSFLYDFENNQTLEFLKNAKENIYLIDDNIYDNVYGSGWAWDDYNYYYQAEKTLFPIYGNVLEIDFVIDTLVKNGTLILNDSLNIHPKYFTKNVHVQDTIEIERELYSNEFYYEKTDSSGTTIPFVTSNQLVAELLSDTLCRKIKIIPNSDKYEFKVFKGIKYSDLYEEMLTVSDNFIAEELMLQVGKAVSDTFSVGNAIKYSLENYLSGFPQEPCWVDGSGLSRYNLITPEDYVYLLEKMYNEIPTKELFSYLPVGGERGTIKKWYKNGKPYIFAKTGTLSNNHNLSGYIRTKEGKILIFSFMNNHYRKKHSEIKREMEKKLRIIYDKY